MPTRIEVPPPAHGERSDPSISFRRGTCSKIAQAVSRLAIHTESENFNAHASEVVESIRDLIAILMDAKEEGNSREILRQVRDTFLNGGWEDYRRPGPREAAARVLTRLATAEEDISPDDVEAAEVELEKEGNRTDLPVGLFVAMSSEEESETK